VRSKRRGGESWQRAAAVAVVLGVAFSVLLMSVAYGVRDNITNALHNPVIRHVGVPVDTIDTILLLLTIVVTAAVLAQTAAMVVILSVTNMRARREEIALRRQSGVLRSRLMLEFTTAVIGACLVGGMLGDILGVVVGIVLKQYTVLPVLFSPVSVLAAFPVTVGLALAATLYPAWRAAGASPALLRKV
jgi:ABC-type lipoprotein release transport system permease subunit